MYGAFLYMMTVKKKPSKNQISTIRALAKPTAQSCGALSVKNKGVISPEALIASLLIRPESAVKLQVRASSSLTLSSLLGSMHSTGSGRIRKKSLHKSEFN